MTSSIIKPRTAVVTIYPGDFLDRIRHLEQLAEAAQQSVDAKLPRIASEIPEYMQIAEEHDELVHEAEAKATHIKVQALPRKVWKALAAAHPPRVVAEGSPVTEAQAADDKRPGVNIDTFREALLYGGEVNVDGTTVEFQTIIEPTLSRDDVDALSEIDFDRVYFAAYSLNRLPGTDPKASLVSRLTPKNDETSS